MGGIAFRAPLYFRPMAAPVLTSKPSRSSPKTMLRPTELPDVFLNSDGAQVDRRGILLSLQAVKAIESQLDAEVLGEPVTTPALLLKRVALDVRLPLETRLRAAREAAPYFDRKMPTALEGGDPDKPVRVESQSVLLKNLSAMSPDDRRAALALLERLGAMGE